jgi:hypothetical protein
VVYALLSDPGPDGVPAIELAVHLDGMPATAVDVDGSPVAGGQP